MISHLRRRNHRNSIKYLNQDFHLIRKLWKILLRKRFIETKIINKWIRRRISLKNKERTVVPQRGVDHLLKIRKSDNRNKVVKRMKETVPKAEAKVKNQDKTVKESQTIAKDSKRNIIETIKWDKIKENTITITEETIIIIIMIIEIVKEIIMIENITTETMNKEMWIVNSIERVEEVTILINKVIIVKEIIIMKEMEVTINIEDMEVIMEIIIRIIEILEVVNFKIITILADTITIMIKEIKTIIIIKDIMEDINIETMTITDIMILMVKEVTIIIIQRVPIMINLIITEITIGMEEIMAIKEAITMTEAIIMRETTTMRETIIMEGTIIMTIMEEEENKRKISQDKKEITRKMRQLNSKNLIKHKILSTDWFENILYN